MCVRHVAEQETRIARQEALIGRLRKSRSPLLDDALRLLAEMHGFLVAMRDHTLIIKAPAAAPPVSTDASSTAATSTTP
jgi:hypothetical protein